MTPSIVISGLTSCGKTYFAHRIRDEFKLNNITASGVLLRLGAMRGLHRVVLDQPSNHHVWLGELDGFNVTRRNYPGLDREVDQIVLDEVQRTRNVIAESLTAPFLLPPLREDILRIYIRAAYKTRVSRAYRSSPTLPLSELETKIQEKDQTSREIILKAWNIDIFDEEAIDNSHDLIINSSLVDNDDHTDVVAIERGKEIQRELIAIVVRSYYTHVLKVDTYLDTVNADKARLKFLMDLYPDLVTRLPSYCIT